MKWWLLAIPQYIIVAVFVGGGGAWAVNRTDNWQWNIGGSGGLVGILVIIAAVILTFTGAYPRSLYDLILGMNRWALRVAGYAALMTDADPPFRLDQGGRDSTLVVPPASGGAPGPAGTAAAAPAPQRSDAERE